MTNNVISLDVKKIMNSNMEGGRKKKSRTKSKSSRSRSKSKSKMKGGKKTLSEGPSKYQNFLNKIKDLIEIKMSPGLNSFLTPFKNKVKKTVGEDDKDKLYSETVKLVKEYVDKHGKKKVAEEIEKINKEVRGKKKSSKKSKSKK